MAPRRRALEIALLLAEPGDVAPDPHAIGLAVLDVLHALSRARVPCSSPWTMSSGSTPASAGVLQIAFRRLRDEHVGLLGPSGWGRTSRAPIELDRTFSESRFVDALDRTAEPGRRPHSARRAAGTRPDPAGARPRAGGDGRQPVLCARARARARPHEHPADARVRPCAFPRACGNCSAAASPGCLPRRSTFCSRSQRSARPTVELVAATYEDEGSCPRGARGGRARRRSRARRLTHPLRASRCSPRSATSGRPVWKRRAVHRALAGVVSDVEERARHLALAADGPDAVVASYLEAAASKPRRVGRPPPAADLDELAAELTPDDPALVRRRRFLSASFHASRVTRTGGLSPRSSS